MGVDSGALQIFAPSWRVEAVYLPPPNVVPNIAQPVPLAPDCVHAFVGEVAKVKGVRCVVVEAGENDSVHVTTFAEKLTDEARNKIYAIEAKTIDAYPNSTFDFHLRRSEEASGSPASISMKSYYAIWGSLDGNGG